MRHDSHRVDTHRYGVDVDERHLPTYGIQLLWVEPIGAGVDVVGHLVVVS
jgi:hypothetical protein